MKKQFFWDFTFANGDTIKEKFDDLTAIIRNFTFYHGSENTPAISIHISEWLMDQITSERKVWDILHSSIRQPENSLNKILFTYENKEETELLVFGIPWIPIVEIYEPCR